MPCLLVIVALLLPRVALFFIWLLTDWIARSFGGAIIPILGFIFLPYATLAYMAAVLNGGLAGWWLVLFIVAILVDVGHWSGGANTRKKFLRI